VVTRERCIIYYWIPGLIIVLLRRCREGDPEGESPRENAEGKSPSENQQAGSLVVNAEGISPEGEPTGEARW
jgi:hypothetical protein